jgi:hypothetical protein
LATDGEIAVRRFDRNGAVVETIKLQRDTGLQP